MSAPLYRLLIILSSLFLLACSSISSTDKTLTQPVDGENDNFVNNHSKANPQLVAAGYNVELGLGYLREGNTALAKTKLLTAQEQAPKDPLVLDALGYYMEATGDNQTAEKYYKEALKQAPNSGMVNNNYGTFLCRISRYQESLPYFLVAVKDPHYVTIADAYENAGLCASQIPKPELAMVYFQKAVDNDPRRATSLLELAQLSYNQNQYPQAADYLQQYLTIVQPSAQSLLLGVQLANKLGNSQQATVDAELLAKNFPHSEEYQRYRAIKSS